MRNERTGMKLVLCTIAHTHRFLFWGDLARYSLVIGRVRRHIHIAMLETSVMDRQVRFNWTLVVVIVCAALASGASFAAERGGQSVPQSGETVSHQEGSPGGRLPESGVAPDKSGTVTGGQNSDLAGDRTDAGDLAARPPAPATASGRAGIKSGSKASGKGGKSAGAARGIDLVRPDDGYINLRRRATRSSLIAAGQKKKLQIVPPVAVKRHPASPAGASVEPLRNSAGVALPLKPDSIHTAPRMPVTTGLAKNSIGLSVNEIQRPETHLTATGAVAPVTGINGTNMGRPGVGGVGGPAKDRSGINGSAFHHKF
jgi:hypothetical protein